MVLFGHDINVTINNTVIAENSGRVSGNMFINIMFGVEHVRIKLDRCYISSSENTRSWLYQFEIPTGLACGITYTYANEHSNGNTVPVYILNTKFFSNYAGAVTFVAGGRSSCTCNSSAYQILIDNCEFFDNSARLGHTALFASLTTDEYSFRDTVQETVLKVRLVIQNSVFHHNLGFSQQRTDLIQFYQLPEVEIINSTFYSNIGSSTIFVYRSRIIFCGQVVYNNNTSTKDGGALHLDESSVLHFNRPGGSKI